MASSDECDDLETFSHNSIPNTHHNKNKPIAQSRPHGDFVLVKFRLKRRLIHYVGRAEANGYLPEGGSPPAHPHTSIAL